MSQNLETCDVGKIFSQELFQLDTSEGDEELQPPEQLIKKCSFPDFGAHLLQQAALIHICDELGSQIHQALSSLSHIPSVVVARKMRVVWENVMRWVQDELYSNANMELVLKAQEKEDEIIAENVSEKMSRSTVSSLSKSEPKVSKLLEEKQTGNALLMEVGIKTGLSVVFSLLRHAWSQIAWQKKLQQALLQSNSIAIGPPPEINLPNEVLKSVLDVLMGISPMSLSSHKTMSQLGHRCLEQSNEFLQWVVSPSSLVDMEGKRVAMEIMILLYLQRGSLVHLLEWVEKMLLLLSSYCKLDEGGSAAMAMPPLPPSLEMVFCQSVMDEVRIRTQLCQNGSDEKWHVFSPESLTESGHAGLMDFLQALIRQLSLISDRCTSYFGNSDPGRTDFFVSQNSEVYAFGSNSSSQLAMRSSDKFHAATPMPHMDTAQMVAAGHYCSFLIYGDGTVKACGKGSYGRLGLGHNELQSTLQMVNTFPAGIEVRNIASSKGSDGHSMAVSADGKVYSWGDGSCWKLGHGDNVAQKTPKLIAALADKVVQAVACGNKHSAAITAQGELYTWGEGDHGRLGHGNLFRVKTPTKVEAIGQVKQVACGEAHTLALSTDGQTVWSFGNGDLGRLGHGDTTKQTMPKVIEALKGLGCQKVCAANQFSLALVGGKVYSFGKGSGVGVGSTEARQLTPAIIEALKKEIIIDITTGDGHCLALTKKGEVYAWGTNSMGQCGQGHSNGSILRPAKVLGLENVQVQQISAGTSHSVVWTALPCNRHASALWHWPYCISVGGKTLEKLVNMISTYSELNSESAMPPFQTMESQKSFVLSLLTLLRTHLSVVASVGPDSVHTACGPFIKPLRHLLFKLVDSQLPPALDKETSAALEVGSSVLLPPVQQRLDLLLSLLPEDPASIVGMTSGQRRQLDILLCGFSSRKDFVGIFMDEVTHRNALNYGSVDLTYINKLFELNHRMVQYLYTATLFELRGELLPQDVRLGSPLLNTFQEFITSVYVNVLGAGKQLVIHHLAPFDHLLRDTSMSVLETIREVAVESENPFLFLQGKQEVLFGFLAYQYPCHVALTISYGLDRFWSGVEELLDVARSVHKLVLLLPPPLLLKLEQEELLWEQKKDEKFNYESLRGSSDQPWKKLMDYERLLCLRAARVIHEAVNSSHISCVDSSALEYSPSVPGKGRVQKKPSLLSSHLLRNGAVGSGEDAIAQAVYMWVSLCKTLPKGSAPTPPVPPPTHATPTLSSWSSYSSDYLTLRADTGGLYRDWQILQRDAEQVAAIEPGSAPVLYALAVGAQGNEKASKAYAAMLDYAKQKDWNTCSDEETVPELKQVSCAALACFLKHSGLTSSVDAPSATPKKKLVDVYRHVFALRHEVFTHRPIASGEGVLSPDDKEHFRLQCNGVCTTLFLFMCILQAAIPEETDCIIPRKEDSSSTTPMPTVSTLKSSGNRSPGSFHGNKGGGGHLKRPFRLLSMSSADEKGKVPPLVHSSSVVPASSDEQDISLSGVKQALSLLRWHRDRLDHLEASSGSASEGSLHITICSMLLDIVTQVFNMDSNSSNDVKLLPRSSLIEALIDHQQRAALRQKCLKRVLLFVEDSKSFLPSSQVIFKSNCLQHNMHYSDMITVAPSILQHGVKSLTHQLVRHMLSRLTTFSPEDLVPLSDPGNQPTLSQLCLKRELMLALQWMNFHPQAGDLQAFFSAELYGKIAELSCVPSTEVSILPSQPNSQLWDRIKTISAFMMQLLAMKISLNADVLKSPVFLEVVSKHLFGQLQCFLDVENSCIRDRWKASDSYSLDMKESMLGDLLRFLNTLCATHSSVQAVLASEQWFTMLLKIVDVNITTGVSVVSSLKTRLLALQVLGSVMSKYSLQAPANCTQIVEDLLELMYRCVFASPVASLQQIVSELTSPLPMDKIPGSSDAPPLAPPPSTVLPFLADPAEQRSVTCDAGEGGSLLVTFDASIPGYFIGQTPLTSGKYAWKVTVESSELPPNFVVGVSHKPLAPNTKIETSDEIWALSYRGSVFHAGETDNTMRLSLSAGDSLELQYSANSASGGTLLCDYGTGHMVVHGISKSGIPVFPFLMFPQDETQDTNLVRLRFDPISYSRFHSFSDFRRREQLASGYPHLSPSGATLAQAMVGLLYQLQEREPWKRAIGQAVVSRLNELESLIHHLLSIEEQLTQPSNPTPQTQSALSLLTTQLTRTVWPALAVMGGLDAGLCLGRACRVKADRKERDDVEAMVVSIPDSELSVEIEEKVTAQTLQKVRRTVAHTDISLTVQPRFSLSLISKRLSPSLLLNLTHMAGYLDQHNIPAIYHRAYQQPYDGKVLNGCLSYQLVCQSMLQMAAVKSLFSVLMDGSVMDLLQYKPPPISLLVEGDSGEDKSEMAEAVVEVLKCLSVRACKPSPLRPVINLLELQKLHNTLTYEALSSVAQHLSTSSAPKNASSSTSTLVPATHSQVARALSVSEGTFDLQPRSLSMARSLSGSYHSNSNMSLGCESGVELGGEEGGALGGGRRVEEVGECSVSGVEFPAAASSSSGHNNNIVTMLMDMGFLRPQINAALERCEVPDNTEEQARLQLLVSWIIDHPDDFIEDEVVVVAETSEYQLELEERRREQELPTHQSTATEDFLYRIGEMLDPRIPTCASSQGSEDLNSRTKHAPDLLQGPDVDQEIPDMAIGDMNDTPTQDLLNPLLSALGISQDRPISQMYQFSNLDPMGETPYKLNCEEDGMIKKNDSAIKLVSGTSTGHFRISPTCKKLVNQAQRLKSMDENMDALNRVTTGAQTLVARHLIVMLISNLSTLPSKTLVSILKKLDLLNIQSLVRLVRLVDAGCICNTPSDFSSSIIQESLFPVPALQSLSDVIAAVVTDEMESEFTGVHLMQSCSRDLLTAAVGGTELIQQTWLEQLHPQMQSYLAKSEASDVCILVKPNFKVTQRLVKILAKSAAKLTSIGSCVGGLVQVMDALAACLFSAKLLDQHRLWALQQLAKVFAVTNAADVLGTTKNASLNESISPSAMDHLIGHKGQILACVENSKEKKILTIGEDNCLLRWDLHPSATHPPPVTTSFPLPEASRVSLQNSFLLPTLTKSYHESCVASAVDQTLCVWKTRDGKSVVHSFPELITALQFRPAQSTSDFPLILVGLVDGTLILAEVVKASVNFTPEIQITDLGRCIKGAVCCLSWSPDGTQFVVASTAANLHLFKGSGREYTQACELHDVQAKGVSWSPDGGYFTVLCGGEQGLLQLWGVGTNSALLHTFHDHRINCMQWYPKDGVNGSMLLATGGKNGFIHLWQVKRAEHADETAPHAKEELVSHVASLEGHVAPVTRLAFNEHAVVLASGCKAGSVRVWDVHSFTLLKFAIKAMSEVIDLTWAEDGLAICYRNTNSLCLLKPGPSGYIGERVLHKCLPLLQHYSIAEPSKAPCLSTFFKSLHELLLQQYQYEEAELAGFKHLVHSEYLQLLTALTVGLDLHSILLSSPFPPHMPRPPMPSEWEWLDAFINTTEMAESFSKRVPLEKDCGFSPPEDAALPDPAEKFQPTANNVWTVSMDKDILEWFEEKPEDWRAMSIASIYTWGNGSNNQLGHSTNDNTSPSIVPAWKDIQMIVAGSYCTYGVRYDSTLCSVGEGSYGRLGHGGSDSESSMRTVNILQGIPVVHVVAGPRVSSYSEEGFALALTHSGDVYSWGKGYKGRLGHTISENARTPKLIEALASKNVKMIASCDYHCAVVTEGGRVYTFGSKENGKLGHGRDFPPSSTGRVTEVEQFYQADERTLIPNVKIGYVSCGQTFTLAITDDGKKVFGWGEAEQCAFGSRRISGDHHRPMLLEHLTPFGPFVKAASGSKTSVLVTKDGRACRFGKVFDGDGGSVPVEYVEFPEPVEVVDVALAGSYTLALTSTGEVYYWGKFPFGSSVQRSPTLIQALSGKGIKQISAGVCHCAASDVVPPMRGVSTITVPKAVPSQFTSLKEVSCEAIYARLLILNHFSKLVSKCWALFSTMKCDVGRFCVNPLSEGTIRCLLSPQAVEGMVARVMGRTMTRRSHGPSITIQRIVSASENPSVGGSSRTVFPQIAPLILQKSPVDLRCPARAWKVNLVGEGADDAGGVFDETIAQMCEEMEGGVVKLLIPTPNTSNKCGFNTDRFVLNPEATAARDYKHLKFLGILLGVAMRTRKPLDLHLAQPMWKLLAGMSLTPVDLEEVDLVFIQTLYGIRDVHKNGIKEDDFSEMIPIEWFEAQSMSGKFVPIVPGGTNIKLTFQNRREYVEKALYFRLHELDEQVAVIREGMSCIVPVPLLSMYTAEMLEHAVCGREHVDLTMLKKVVRYKDDATEGHRVVQWLWETLQAFSNDEKILFLRFVSGRSRLPVRISDIPQRFRISIYGQSQDSLPTSQTCFFQLRLPNYPSKEILGDRLRYAIRNCRSIDMDNYMLRRNDGGDGLIDYDDDDDDDDDDDFDI